MRTDSAPDFDITDTGRGGIALAGALTVETLPAAQARLEALVSGATGHIDLSGVTRFDTAGAWLIVGLERRLAHLSLAGVSAEAESLIAAVRAAWPEPPERAETGDHPFDAVAGIGRALLSGGGSWPAILAISAPSLSW